jgi:hypothetical protein
MLYNTTLIYVLQLLGSLSPLHASVLPHQCPPKPFLDGSEHLEPLPQGSNGEHATAEHSAALEICRCIPYFLLQKSRLDASSLTIAHLAVKTAWSTLGGSDSPAGCWMRDLLSKKGGEVYAEGLRLD